ncbi:MAG TPA: Xaa-Pro peptidase family protein [Terriglobia bacterium]|nr:Xaa-Pro peptidase family protein [Terriglobia bacterium]
MLTSEGCRNRQNRMLKEMVENRWDLFASGDYRTTYYFTGGLCPADTPVLFLLWQDGRTSLISTAKTALCCDELVQVETYSIQRCITRPMHDASILLRDVLSRSSASMTALGLEVASVPAIMAARFTESHPHIKIGEATEALLNLRKRKEPDEVASIRESLKYCAVAYRAARETIAPGKTEIDVYNAMASAIYREAGTTIVFAGDFACGERGIKEGGPPTSRVIRSGDLYILDIFPAVKLYAADTCRTFAVGSPTDAQHRAWQVVMEAVHMAESLVRPGVPARSVYQEIKNFLDSHELTEKSFWHHLGHGIGHRGHEAPRIIPGSDDIFEEGDVFTLEPGVYTKALQGGIRLEDNYVLRANGPEDLFDFPWEL